MRIHGMIKSTTVNGPGDRALIHVQGCVLKCAGCWNPETHDINPSTETDEDYIFNWILKNAKDGITFSGGEPIHQIVELENLIYRIKAAKPKLSVGIYTGYSLKELDNSKYVVSSFYKYVPMNSRNPWLNIKKNLDFAVMGRFNQSQTDVSRPLLSSKNQELVLFSNRYTISDFEQQEIEFTIGNNGMVQITGFPVNMPNLLLKRNW